MKTKYEYRYWKECVNQYADTDYLEGKAVEARYIRRKCESLSGNPFAECLPVLKNAEEIDKTYHIKPKFDAKKIRSMSTDDRIDCLRDICRMRVPLGFEKKLERELYNAIIKSYDSRDVYRLSKKDSIVVNNRNEEIDIVLTADKEAGAVVGFSLIGCPGCGKTNIMARALKHYPQVIYHDLQCNRRIQVVYLVVECVANSNLRALYDSIARQLDKAVKSSYYEDQMRKKRDLASKSSYLCELIERFAIGIIIFDEIQLMDFKSNKESSFEGLLTINNTTNVAMAFIGNEESFEKMAYNERIKRRVGNIIDAGGYCNDYMQFSDMIKELWEYCLFDKEIELTQNMKRVIFKESNGVISYLIRIFEAINMDYLEHDERPDVNAEYVSAISKECMRKM